MNDDTVYGTEGNGAKKKGCEAFGSWAIRFICRFRCRFVHALKGNKGPRLDPDANSLEVMAHTEWFKRFNLPATAVDWHCQKRGHDGC